MIVSLTTPSGNFVLVPSANVVTGSDTLGVQVPSLMPDSDMSPDRFLNEKPVDTRYETLGSEVLNNRATKKYRVITTSQTIGTTPASETLIWIDDALGMPVRWEARSAVNGIQGETIMELSEISLEVELGVFAVPADYRKVSMDEVLNLIQGRKQQETPKTVQN
jgi:outer membrane lipoprotein-sorting protein